ncbi:MAG: DUF4332 domain-containing protein [Bryobacteraceae bacterium]|nr:DUF4332 domain-containing protein [Bryobacteraceae bacterium]
MGTGYVFQNILLCLLLAGIIGTIVGWLLKTFLSAGKLTEVEDLWRGRLGAVEGERDSLAVHLKEAKANFEGISGKVPGLEAALAAGAVSAANLTADLKACSEARARLEAQVADWTVKARAWDTERARFESEVRTSAGKLTEVENLWRGRLGAVEGERDTLAVQLKEVSTSFEGVSARVPGLEAAVAASAASAAKLMADLKACSDARGTLEAQVADWTAKAKAWDTERARFEAEVSTLQADAGKLRAGLSAAGKANADLEGAWQARFTTVEGERNQFFTQLSDFTARAATTESGYKTRISELEQQLARLKKEDEGEDAAFRQEIAGLKSRTAQLEAEGRSLYDKHLIVIRERDSANAEIERMRRTAEAENVRFRMEIEELKQRAQADRDALVARMTDAETAWTARHAELERKLAAPMAMAAAAGAGSAAAVSTGDGQFRQLKSRFDSFLVRMQKEGYGDIERIEGIGPVFGQKLRSIGINWVRELLEQGASPAGRERIVEETGIKRELILRWVNAADLLRVEGVTPDWAELLEASGVDTVKELRNRVPANLHRKMEETNPTNGAGTYAREVPPVEVVARWVEIARTLDPKVTH